MFNQNIDNIKLHLDKRVEILNLLSQLTNCTTIDKERFDNIVYSLKDNHNIYIYIKNNRVVGIITLLIEQKLIHNGACVAHIEDLVVDKEYSGQGIARELINYCLSKLSSDRHYKVILNCTEELKKFYEKFGFTHTKYTNGKILCLIYNITRIYMNNKTRKIYRGGNCQNAGPDGISGCRDCCGYNK